MLRNGLGLSFGAHVSVEGLTFKVLAGPQPGRHSHLCEIRSVFPDVTLQYPGIVANGTCKPVHRTSEESCGLFGRIPASKLLSTLNRGNHITAKCLVAAE